MSPNPMAGADPTTLAGQLSGQLNDELKKRKDKIKSGLSLTQQQAAVDPTGMSAIIAGQGTN